MLSFQLVLYVGYRLRTERARPAAEFQVSRLDETERAPDLTLTPLHGIAETLDALRGRVVILHIWATWCAPCRAELPSLLARVRAMDGGGRVALRLVAPRDDVPALERFFGGAVPPEVVLDAGGEAMRTLGVTTLPDTFVISREGRLTHRLRGSRDWSSAAAEPFLAEVFRSRP